MSLRAELTEVVADVFTDVWDELEGGGELSLLKQSETTRDFDTIETFTSKFFFEYSDYRRNTLVEIAEDESITDAINEATHLQIDDDVYVIRQADTTPPKGTDVTWKIYCDKYAKRDQFGDIL